MNNNDNNAPPLRTKLVAYFLAVLAAEGRRFCRALLEAGVAVPGLRAGWFGLQVDLSDPQWRDFRASIPLLSAVFGVFVAASRAVRRGGGAGWTGVFWWHCRGDERAAAGRSPILRPTRNTHHTSTTTTTRITRSNATPPSSA